MRLGCTAFGGHCHFCLFLFIIIIAVTPELIYLFVAGRGGLFLMTYKLSLPFQPGFDPPPWFPNSVGVNWQPLRFHVSWDASHL